MMNYLVSMNRHLRITIFFVLIFTSFYFLIDTGNLFFALLFFMFLGILIASNISHTRFHYNILSKSVNEALNMLNFQYDDSYASNDYLSGIALNKTKNVIAFLNRNNINEEFKTKYYGFIDILECGIREDGQTVTHSINSSMIGRAMAGGVLFGGIGAAVGAMGAKNVSTQKILKCTLSIVVDDLDEPLHEINFINSKIPIDKNSEFYIKRHNDLNKWDKMLSVIIKRNEQDSKLS